MQAFIRDMPSMVQEAELAQSSSEVEEAGDCRSEEEVAQLRALSYCSGTATTSMSCISGSLDENNDIAGM